MTIGEMKQRMSAREVERWKTFFRLREQDREQARDESARERQAREIAGKVARRQAP